MQPPALAALPFQNGRASNAEASESRLGPASARLAWVARQRGSWSSPAVRTLRHAPEKSPSCRDSSPLRRRCAKPGASACSTGPVRRLLLGRNGSDPVGVERFNTSAVLAPYPAASSPRWVPALPCALAVNPVGSATPALAWNCPPAAIASNRTTCLRLCQAKLPLVSAEAVARLACVGFHVTLWRIGQSSLGVAGIGGASVERFNTPSWPDGSKQ